MIPRLTILTLTLATATAAAAPGTFEKHIAPFFAEHCTACHGTEKQKGKTTLHDLTGDVAGGGRTATWSAVYDMLTLGEMPPEDEPQPDAALAEKVAEWVRIQLEAADVPLSDKLSLPSHGNYVDHATLFDKKPTGVAKPPPRLWRLRPAAYDANLQQIAKGSYTTPFTLNTSTGGFQDYANLYKLDDGTLGLLLGNARAAADRMAAFKIENGKAVRDGWGTPDQFLRILDPSNKKPTTAQLETAVDWQFSRVLQRPPTSDEKDRMVAFLKDGIAKNGKRLGLRNMIAAVLLTPEALYRSELGEGDPDIHGRVRLAPREIAHALAYALTDQRPADDLLRAADSGKLDTAEGVATAVRGLLDNPKVNKPRILDFFREYFGYTTAADVFKDEKLFPQHRPRILVSDTDRLVQHILAEDRDVFRQLLTTQLSFVNFAEDSKTGPRRAERQRMVHLSYNLPPDWKFDPDQPVELPGTQRAGILTQPSWLVANSDNFDNHIIHRGKWVRERLLGGHTPDLPITVDAQLPDEKHETLRHRMRVTRDVECWRCHKLMNPLGNPFENFDHFGRWRPYETVLDAEATAANVNHKGEPQGDIFKRVAYDSTGDVDGHKVTGAVDMIHKLAKTDLARQVWVRHAFRYFMGRNETAADAATLQAADQAYRGADGSFQELLVSLLTSDSFLMRVQND